MQTLCSTLIGFAHHEHGREIEGDVTPTRARSYIYTCIHRCGGAPWRRPRTPPFWPSPGRRRQPWPRRCCAPRRCPRATGATAGRRRRRRLSSSGASSSRRRRRLRRVRWAARRRWVQHGSHRARTTGASSASCARSPLSWPPRPASPSLSYYITPPLLSLSIPNLSLSQNRSVSLSRPAARPRRLSTGMLLAMSSQDQEGNQPASRAAVCERDHVLRCCFIELAR